MLYLFGAAVGYAAMMAFQPQRRVFGEAHRTIRNFPRLWLVVGVFESIRLTLAVVVAIATGAVAPEDFVRGGGWEGLPYVAELPPPAMREGGEGFLAIATSPVRVFPISALLAAALIGNAGGVLRTLWANKDLGGRLFAIVVSATAGVHLMGAPWVWLSKDSAAVPVLDTWVLGAGSRLFEVVVAVAVQGWLVLWFIRARRRRFLEVPLGEALERTRALAPLIFVYWMAGEGMRAMGMERPGGWWSLVLVVVALWAFPAQIRTIGGEAGWLASLRKHGTWVVVHFEGFLWWGAVAGVHLMLLSMCGLGVGGAVGEVPWAGWIWGVFFAFLKAGVIVWLLGAFVGLVEESVRPTRRAKGRTRKKGRK